MAMIKSLLVFGIFAVAIQEIYGHGKMMDPINRSSLWRFPEWRNLVPVNTEDNENFCGGFVVQYKENSGNCGPCGDNYTDKVPRKNENGGKFGKGYIAKTYNAGQRITAVVDLTANHLGHFSFSICVLPDAYTVETEECFNQHPLQVVDRNGQLSDKYSVERGDRGEMSIEVYLPANLRCERCVLRWNYEAGNNWGICNSKSGVGRLGCGPQETFRSCADVAIH